MGIAPNISHAALIMQVFKIILQTHDAQEKLVCQNSKADWHAACHTVMEQNPSKVRANKST